MLALSSFYTSLFRFFFLYFQELSGSVSAGGSEPDLNAVPSATSIDTGATLSEDDKPKDKSSKYLLYSINRTSGTRG